MKKEIKFTSGFDKRHSDPSKSYGIHGAEICFILSGAKGAITFTIYTGWYLPSLGRAPSLPMGVDIRYHSPVETEYGYHRDSCPYLDGKPCWSDGSGLAAQELLENYLDEEQASEEYIWDALQKRYDQRLNSNG